MDEESLKLDSPDRSLVDRLIFWKEPEKPGIALDSRRESQRLRENARTLRAHHRLRLLPH